MHSNCISGKSLCASFSIQVIVIAKTKQMTQMVSSTDTKFHFVHAHLNQFVSSASLDEHPYITSLLFLGSKFNFHDKY